MDNLLRSLRYQMFTVVAADNAVRAVGATKLLEEHFDSSNFGVRMQGILNMTNTNYPRECVSTCSYMYVVAQHRSGTTYHLNSCFTCAQCHL